MNEPISQETLLSSINSLKLQLGSALDKALKVSELEQREKYVDSISCMKRDLEQLKTKVEKTSKNDLNEKTYNKIALKLNTLVG